MKTTLAFALAAVMIFAGVMHFVRPNAFVRIVPAVLPFKEAIVALSGAIEILLGAGLLVPQTRVLAAWGLVALYIAVFPANVNMAVNQIPFGSVTAPFLLWARLPFQAVFIAWAYWLTS
jgi:uncharacterized membrane protein